MKTTAALVTFVAIANVASSQVHRETPTLPPQKGFSVHPLRTSPARIWERNGHQSVQVNVILIDGVAHNIEGDAANEPSIAVDPGNPLRMSIGWRQFDTVESDFRQSGWATTHDGGRTWPFSGTLTPGAFASDPVLASDAVGNFYYASINGEHVRLFRSFDGGVTWEGPITVQRGFRDKPWMTVDNPGGNIYLIWNHERHFTRSTDGGDTFSPPITTPLGPLLTSTIAIDPEGVVFLVDENRRTAKSSDAQSPRDIPTFVRTASASLLGSMVGGAGPNPNGLLGQVFLAADSSSGPTRGNIYMLGSVRPWRGNDPLDVMFARSTDGCETWERPLRVNDDPIGNRAWQWFGTMSVAPNGRIDAIWNDTRASGSLYVSELYYAKSTDGGETWSENVPVSPRFDSRLGWPVQAKLGDYYHTVSDNEGVDVAYAATFNGEQDIYYLRLGAPKINEN